MAPLHKIPARFIAAQLLRALMPMMVQATTSAGPALVIDGRVRVMGATLQAARMVVERDGIPIATYSTGLDRFSLPLELQRIYLITFEHPECMAKQLLFDTHVPEALHPLAPFDFPFKVTLEPVTGSVRYAGPVGFVRFHVLAQDFNYDRDYTMVRDGMDAVPAESSTTHAQMGTDPPATAPVSSTSTVKPDVVSPTLDAPAPARGEAPSARSKSPMPATHNASVPLAAGAAIKAPVAGKVSSTPVAPADTSTMVRVPSKATAPMPTARKIPARPSSVAPAATPSAPASPPPDGRTTELLIEKLRVTTIVRITAVGRTTEYRRVASRYGAVYYFKNGISCSENTYTMGSCER